MDYVLQVGDVIEVCSFRRAQVDVVEFSPVSDRLSEQLAPALLSITEAVRRFSEPMLVAEKSFRDAFDHLTANQKQWSEAIEAFAANAERFRNSFQEAVGPALQGVQKSLQELPLRTQEAVLLLGSYGWYFDLAMTLPQLWRLKEALSGGNVREAEEALIDYFEDRIDEIEKSASNVFSGRSHLIRAAFSAHRRQEYELSIPVLLAQADGMCKDAVDKYLFLKENKKPQTALYVEQLVANTFKAALLSPLARNLPISASQRERGDGATALNRHMVLHGESLDYGTKANSLKAISLINYVTQILGKKLTSGGRERSVGN